MPSSKLTSSSSGLKPATARVMRKASGPLSPPATPRYCAEGSPVRQPWPSGVERARLRLSHRLPLSRSVSCATSSESPSRQAAAPVAFLRPSRHLKKVRSARRGTVQRYLAGLAYGEIPQQIQAERRRDTLVFRSLCGALLALSFPLPFCLARAMIWYVSSKAGSDASDGRTPQTTFKTLQHACRFSAVAKRAIPSRSRRALLIRTYHCGLARHVPPMSSSPWPAASRP